MFCANCGNKLVEGAVFCGHCGAASNPAVATSFSTTEAGGSVTNVYVQAPVATTPPRDFVAAWLLSWFLGSLGVDRFYLGYVGMGIGKLAVTICTLGFAGWIWPTIDLILLLAGKLPDAQGRPLVGYEQKKRMAIWVTVGVSVGSLLLTLMLFGLLIAVGSSSTPLY